MASMMMYVSTATSAVMTSVCLLGLQLLNLVPEPVKAVILLFPIRGKLDELRKREEEEIKEKGAVPVDPTVFWIKQTVRLAGAARLRRMIIAGSDQ
jgi:ubiquitin carboxyl-terminal hydrolase L3